jgi:hypothetical protein
MVAGLTNAKMKISFPANVSFEDVKIVPLPKQETGWEVTNQTRVGRSFFSTFIHYHMSAEPGRQLGTLRDRGR